jgi:Tfp pilus assembly PilM family ATPase
MVIAVRAAGLPLGVDLGASRVRVAYAERDRSGTPRVVAVASRDVEAECGEGDGAETLAAVIDELRREIGARVRGAVIAMPPWEASLKILRFPKMGWAERRRAAAFEVERFAAWDVKNVRTLVRVHALNGPERLHAVGAVRETALSERLNVLKRAGFRAAGADYTALAMHRAFPAADAVLDIGLRRSVLYGFGAHGPAAVEISVGGEAVTAAIAAALSIDRTLAEKRKRILGTAGAGEEARGDLAARAAAAVTRMREAMPVRRIALTGNGARLNGFAADLEAATEALVEVPVSELLQGGAYPDDVIRAAAPDWAMAAALASWGSAG